MGKRQLRLSFAHGVPIEIKEWINSPVTIVKKDNTVIFVNIQQITSTGIRVKNTAGKVSEIHADVIQEIIIDFHA